ncbi:phosphonoacetate hydrolase [Staphylococcus saprophyticus]|jgi:protein PhnA|uniref:zinc ribbon domain-containing protein YjdM n=1 Tax=Staphylococcus saprophyticus TaxID=29385 RepID=UPI000852F3DD|nr:zinc ribbon domain-containing protein YjdM [Staphylococcus saprophyticus]MBC2921295.1 alkylphosphonate utilization protein [Staphylococcus saprophyticus]MBC2957993.1 alkylphosphonate utilization protein [Staphylococcus saprophyticus]MBC3010091.1 alkylphosphonate utilization protein [Staphylococcus saprophyticus]MBC3023614.1 alkylphosphonate utilization protein [Staphylococcus saprophyticus]MBC3030622.1 alkylphosphonate utilization protein [Staphylococcus saprophyticus]
MEYTLPNCPKCESSYTYEDGNLLVCPMCGYEWSETENKENMEAQITRDVNGHELVDGDSVTVIKDLKVKGTSFVIKQGTKVKSIRIVEPEDGHDIDAKVDKIGLVGLKSSLVKKLKN